MDRSLEIAQVVIDTIEPMDATAVEKWTALKVALVLQSRPSNDREREAVTDQQERPA